MEVIVIGLLACYGIIFIQDLKHRSVYWFLFPLIAILGVILLFQHLDQSVFLATILVNVSFVILLLSIVFVYTRLKLKIRFDEAIALGDILMFLAIACSFPTTAFVVLFVFSLIFSLILHLTINQNSKYESVPLAGNMSLFFGIAYILNWTGIINSLYI